MKTKIIHFFSKPFFTNRKYIIGIWMIIAIIAAVKSYVRNKPEINQLTYNNYNIFTGVYKHIVKQVTLYGEYPQEYFDANHYGPFFSVIIMPFAVLPDWLGIVLWNVSLTALLAFALFKLPFKEIYKVAIAWIVLNELITAQLALQFNIALVALILLSFSYIRKHQFFAGSVAIVVGLLVKLYGIVGLVFVLFLKGWKQKLIFLATFLFVFIVLLFLPIIITSPEFLYQSYIDWYKALLFKSDFNQNVSDMANISVIGIMDKVFGIKVHVLQAVAFGSTILLAILLLKRKYYDSLKFQFFILCYVLFCLVLFNTNVESPTFIIAFFAIAIWFILVEKNSWTISLFVFAIVLTSLSPTDIFPKFLREQYVMPYKLKVLPCILIWIDLTVRLFKTNFMLPKHQLSHEID